MKYLAGIGMGKVPVFVPGAPGAGTLTFKQPLNNAGGVEVLVCVNTSTNDILYNNNNSDNSGTFSGGGGTFDLVLRLDNSTVTMNSTDDIHAWIEIRDGAKGIDFMSDLVVKDKSYAAMKNIELSTESLTIDMTATTSAVTDGASFTTNTLAQKMSDSTTAITEGASATTAAVGASTTDITDKLDLVKDRLESLLEVPDSYIASIVDNYAEYTIGQANLNTDGTDIDLSGTVNIVNIRSTNDNTKVTVYKDSAETVTLANEYELGIDRFLDLKSEKIKVEQIVAGATQTAAEVIIHVVK